MELKNMNQIEKAIYLAVSAHAGQVDKAGVPYILHPLTVAYNQPTEEGFIVGMLHDIVEDTPITIENLKELGFSKEVVETVELLTHKEGENYLDYVRRIKEKSQLATQVKLADLAHNSDLSRLPSATDKDIARVKEKYEPAMAILLEGIER